ncbi:hypothetical protein HDU78_006580 [Chytriomyces hyalinus]|nr:hypothetical protein HDU78_006580 [Chytriomyces hyalinus]
MPNRKGDTLVAANDALVILGALRETVQRSDNAEHVRRQQMELLEEALRVLNASDASDDAQSEERLDAEALAQERDLLKNVIAIHSPSLYLLQALTHTHTTPVTGVESKHAQTQKRGTPPRRVANDVGRYSLGGPVDTANLEITTSLIKHY